MIYGRIYVEDPIVTNRQRAMTEATLYINVYWYIHAWLYSEAMRHCGTEIDTHEREHGAYSGELSHTYTTRTLQSNSFSSRSAVSVLIPFNYQYIRS